jgi:NADH-quinone oxidoreductase subunit H
VIFVIKVAFFLFMFIWIRATLPRIRYDRLMRLGWTLLLPLAVLNVVITATVVAFGWPWWINGLAGVAIIVAVLFYERRTNILAQTIQPDEKMALPSSVRLAKFEKIATEQVPTAREVKV